MIRRFNERGEYLSKEQFRIVCHLKKSKALSLIKNGLVPAIDTGIPTKRYQIAMGDVLQYLHDREQVPEKYGYRKMKGRIYDVAKEYSPDTSARVKHEAEKLLSSTPDMMAVGDVVTALGYSRYTIYRWCKKKWVKHISIGKKFYIPKKSLLAFIESKEFHDILYKSDQHIHLLRRANYAGK